jgi:hypothetical protein
MSTKGKNPVKCDEALNDASSGQLGEEPRSSLGPSEPGIGTDNSIRNSSVRAARKTSRYV